MNLKLPLFSALSIVLLAQGCSPKASDEQAPRPVTLNELESEISSRQGDVVVVNFWATWCQPCRREFPDLVQFGKDFEDKGVDIVFVSTDFETDLPVAADFLKEHNVPWKTFAKTGVDNAFISAFHQQWSGALPATFVYDRRGNLRAFWEGMTSYGELEKTVGALL